METKGQQSDVTINGFPVGTHISHLPFPNIYSPALLGMEMWKRNPNYPTFVSAKMVIWISVFVFKVHVKMDISEFDLQTRIRISEFWADSDVKRIISISARR
jgi:hypothetical protein